MKKIAVLLLLLLVLMPTSALAAENIEFSAFDLVDDVPTDLMTFDVVTSSELGPGDIKFYGSKGSKHAYDKGGTDLTDILTDGNSATYVTAGLDQNNKFYRTIYAKFQNDITIDISTIKITFKSGGNQSLFSTKFYDINGKVLKTLSSGGTTLNVNLKGVAGFSIAPEGSYYVEYYFADFLINGTVYVPEDPNLYVIKNLTTGVLNNTGFFAKWDSVNGVNLNYYRVLLNDQEFTTTETNLSFTNLNRDLTYTVQVSAVDLLNKEYEPSVVVFEFPPPDLEPPGKPVGLQVTPDIYTATLTWTLGNEDDLYGYYVFIDGKQINTLPHRSSSYSLTGLKADTDYVFMLKAVDTSGNVSVASDGVTFRTLAIKAPPTDAPVLTGVVGNGYASLNWTPVKYAEVYNVYQDGDKIIETDATRLNLKKLQNGQDYEFYVTAENELGVSPPSNILTVTPSEQFVPDVSLSYGLKDIADGVSSWFKSYWLLLAFCIAIPLSFYIANRVKGLFMN